MLECYSRTWGGDGNGLIACTATWEIADPFWRLAEALDADHWALFTRTARGLQMSDPASYSERLAEQVKQRAEQSGITLDQAREEIEPQLLRGGSGRYAAPEALSERIRRRMAPLASAHVSITAEYSADAPPSHGLVDMCELTYQPTRFTGIDTTGLPTAVELLVAARTGLVAPGHLARLQERGPVDQDIAPAGADLTALLKFAWTGDTSANAQFATEEFIADNPLAQSRLGCSWFTLYRPGIENEPFVVVCGDSADDFCYAYTRSRVAGPTYWFPVGTDTEDISEELYAALAQLLCDVAQRPPGSHPVLITSLTLDEEELRQVRDRLMATPWGHILASAPGSVDVTVCGAADLPVRRIVGLLDKVHFGDTMYEPFLGTDQARNVEIPLPVEARGVAGNSCRWQVDIEDPRHILPARWALRTALAADENSTYGMRSSTIGISIDSHARMFTFPSMPLSQRLAQVRLRFPTPEQTFSALLAGSGLTLEESDKGRYTRRMIELWGSFNALADDLKAGPCATLLSTWISPTGGLPGRLYQGRRYLTLADTATITGQPEGQARELMDRYLQCSIATRGLLLTCERCKGTTFYRLEDVGPGFRCQRCRQDNDITRSSWKGQTTEPLWCYGLDEVAYQGLDSNIHVPILALATLANSARSFQTMPEAVIRRSDAGDIEIDLWAIADGRIVIGEAKISDQLEPTQRKERVRCAVLRDLAKILTVDEFVMATTCPEWDERTRTLVEAAIAPSAPVRWLTNLR
jgi:hypothetical protein